MSGFLTVGWVLGAVAGLLHGAGLYFRQGGLKGAYDGLWAFALWAVFGPYVLTFWLLGAAFWLVAHILPLRRLWAARGLS